MLQRIRGLSLDALVEGVLRATDVPADLVRNGTVELRIASLREYLVLAVAGIDPLQIEQPLVEAFVRTHHHPAAPQELPANCERLVELSRKHPELAWDKQIVQALLWCAIHAHGDHEVDTAVPPWERNWGPADGAARALFVFITYDAFGSLEGTDPAAEAARQHLEQQTIDLAKQMRDAIDRYDDPDVAARREEYERAKAERIGAQLASFYVRTGQRDGNEPLDHAIAKMLRYLAHRVETEVPDAGSAPTIDQPLPTLASGARVWLDLVASSPDRELVLRIKSRDGTTTSHRLLHGTKVQLVAYLEAPSTPKALIDAIDHLKAHSAS